MVARLIDKHAWGVILVYFSMCIVFSMERSWIGRLIASINQSLMALSKYEPYVFPLKSTILFQSLDLDPTILAHLGLDVLYMYTHGPRWLHSRSSLSVGRLSTPQSVVGGQGALPDDNLVWAVHRCPVIFQGGLVPFLVSCLGSFVVGCGYSYTLVFFFDLLTKRVSSSPCISSTVLLYI